MVNALSELQEIPRAQLVNMAFRVEWITVGWMVIESAVALWSGAIAHSLVLIAFGADSFIELLSAGVLIWRLTIEIKQGTTFSESTEQTASRIGGSLLFALAAYVAAAAAWSLWTRQGGDFSVAGLAVTVLAIPIMHELASWKMRLAEALSSRALRADAVESITCLYLAAVAVAALLAQFLMTAFHFDGWWVGPVASLGIVWFLIKEGREAWESDHDGDDD